MGNHIKEFYNHGEKGISRAVAECIESGYRPLSMPEIINIKIDSSVQDKNWSHGCDSISLRIRGNGKTSNVSHKGGTELVFISHDYLPSQCDIVDRLKEYGLGKYGYGNILPEDFQRLLRLEDGKMNFVMAREDMWPNDIYGIDTPTKKHMQEFGGKIDGVDMIAINHPEIRAFLTPEKIEAYLKKHKTVRLLGNDIGIVDYDDRSVMPACRLLKVGGYFSGGSLGFTGSESLENPSRIRRFIGIRE